MKTIELPHDAPVSADSAHEHTEPDSYAKRETLGARLRAHRINRRPLLELLTPDSKRNIEETE